MVGLFRSHSLIKKYVYIYIHADLFFFKLLIIWNTKWRALMHFASCFHITVFEKIILRKKEDPDSNREGTVSIQADLDLQ